jgi:isoamylase
VAGDEMGRTQAGNNNAYCQDNPISWVDWERAAEFGQLAGFTARLTRLRREHPVFRRRRFFQGHPVRGTGLADIGWLTPAGQPMTDQEWTAGQAGPLAVFLNGSGIPEPDRRGRRVVDDSFLLLVNPTGSPVEFTLPGAAYGRTWQVCLDTAEATAADTAEDGTEDTPEDTPPDSTSAGAGQAVPVAAHSLRLLTRPAHEPG